MKLLFKSILLMSFLLVPVAFYAQGSGSTAPKAKAKSKSTRATKTRAKRTRSSKKRTRKRSRRRTRRSNFAVRRSVRGVVRSISRSRVVVRRSNGRLLTLRYNRKTRRTRGCLVRGKRIRAVYSGRYRNASRITCYRSKRKRKR